MTIILTSDWINLSQVTAWSRNAIGTIVTIDDKTQMVVTEIISFQVVHGALKDKMNVRILALVRLGLLVKEG